jgi:hypothetical protein
MLNGDPERTRTSDLWVRNPTLYPLSYEVDACDSKGSIEPARAPRKARKLYSLVVARISPAHRVRGERCRSYVDIEALMVVSVDADLVLGASFARCHQRTHRARIGDAESLIAVLETARETTGLHTAPSRRARADGRPPPSRTCGEIKCTQDRVFRHVARRARIRFRSALARPYGRRPAPPRPRARA